jgi:hypothetical protein
MPTQSSSFELPDAELRELQYRINADAKAGRINFVVTRNGEDEGYSIIFQDGPRRATVPLNHRPSEADFEDISTALHSWANYSDGGASSYTTEVPKDPGSEWS